MRTPLTALFTGVMAVSLLTFCASGARYSKNVSAAGTDVVVIQLESVGDMSADQMRNALLTEAAHETIDRGNLFLRVDELSTDADMAVRQQSSTSSAPGAPSSLKPAPSGRTVQTSEISFSRHRHGTIRFSVSRERPSSGDVYDASRLLDQLRAGSAVRP